MTEKNLTEELKRCVVMGHMDEDDEGFDGDMEGQPGVMELVDQALKESVPVSDLLTSFNSAMAIVGEKYESGEYMIPDMLASAECVGEAMDKLAPQLAEGGHETKGKFVIATVKGDLHDIGKNIVSTMLKGSGYEVKDLGINVETPKIVDAVRENDATFLGLSALLTTTMGEMEAVIKELESAGIRDKVKVLIGGAPTSPEFAKKIGADLYCRDAFDAVESLSKITEAA